MTTFGSVSHGIFLVKLITCRWMMFLTDWKSLRETLYRRLVYIYSIRSRVWKCRGKNNFGRKTTRNASSVRLAIELDSSWLTKLMDIRKCLVVGRQRAPWLLSLVFVPSRSASSDRVMYWVTPVNPRLRDGNGLPSASSVFGCRLEEEGNGWDCERREDLSSPPQQRPATRREWNGRQLLADCWGPVIAALSLSLAPTLLFSIFFLLV
jgi:hypothetical protein